VSVPTEYTAYLDRGATVSVTVHCADKEYQIDDVDRIDIYHTNLVLHQKDNNVPVVFSQWLWFHRAPTATTGATTRLAKQCINCYEVLAQDATFCHACGLAV
jgi:hypothetical protein